MDVSAGSGSITPYQFPTTVVLVDDNADFLTSFSLELDPDLAYRLFASPQAALEYLQRPAALQPLHLRCFAEHRDAVGWSLSDHLIRLDLAALEKEMGNRERFSEVSVVLVDYDMPGMDGLSFCERIGNRQIKKVLLTGVGDEKVAVEGFNRGVIDRFIPKGRPDAAAEVNRAVAELQAQYFREVSSLIHRSLSIDSRSFLEDPAFVAYFEELRRSRRYIEHYYAVEPGGLLLADAAGNIARLLVYTEPDMQAQWEIASDQGCPAELADALQRREVVPYFWDTGGYYRPERAVDWRQYVHPARVVEGRQRYYVALLQDPPPYQHAARAVTSYNDYLDWLDSDSALCSF